MEIESSKDFQIAVEGQQHTLTINDPYPEDTGVFLISASNNFGKATSTGMWFKIIKDSLMVYLKIYLKNLQEPWRNSEEDIFEIFEEIFSILFDLCTLSS